MQKLALAVSVLGISAASAFAADLPIKYKAKPQVVAVYDWSGFYVGGNGGGGWASKCWDLNQTAAAVLIPDIREGCSNGTGGTAGGQVGYRWQTGALVAGLEAQGNWANLKGSNLSNPAAFGPGVTNQSKVDALAFFGGEFGYAYDNTLFYVKSGVAVTSDKYRGITTATGAAFDESRETRVGYAAGAGLEYGFAPNWSAAIEYEHFFMFQSANDFTSIATRALSRVDTIQQDVDLVTVRVNYHFGGPIIAKY